MNARTQRAAAIFSRNGLFLFTFSITLFISALLLFTIQPLMGKALLPKLGGTPQVWNACMVFFQATLFAGYLHAHLSGRLLGLRGQAALHLALAAAALLTLPAGMSGSLAAPGAQHPALWLFQALAVSVGAPMFIVSATAPLLQKWFAHTSHPDAADPYFLYVASNLGSLLALLAYPVLIEPLFDLGEQGFLWSAGFCALALLVGACAAIFYRDFAPMSAPAAPAVPPAAAAWPLRARWLALSFVPSSLLLGVTTYITTDVAAVPLFWIAPLALYLVTFIIAFSRRRAFPHGAAVRAHAIALSFMVCVLLIPGLPMVLHLFTHLAVFFLTALVCHGELAASRPHAAQLTGFYVWMSLGGVLGGMFNTLLAPVVFNDSFEYPLVLALSCVLRPGVAAGSGARRRWLDVMLPLIWAGAILLLLPAIQDLDNPVLRIAGVGGLMIAAAVTLLGFSEHRLRFLLAVAAGLACGIWLKENAVSGPGFEERLWEGRSFFGIYKVSNDAQRGVHFLKHGTTVHGAQLTAPGQTLRPMSYYYAEGPFGRVFQAIGPRLGGKPVAIVGLGAGALACYANPGSTWTFYEIDPLIEKLARNPAYFTYLRDCAPRAEVLIGDARLTMRSAPEAGFGLIVIDAFTSDAIPIHLLTREAIAGYLAKLAPDGVLLLHTSNRYLELVPVVASLARDAGLTGLVSHRSSADDVEPPAAPAQVVVLARRLADLDTLVSSEAWAVLPEATGQRVWSDSYVNILSVLRLR